MNICEKRLKKRRRKSVNLTIFPWKGNYLAGYNVDHYWTFHSNHKMKKKLDQFLLMHEACFFLFPLLFSLEGKEWKWGYLSSSSTQGLLIFWTMVVKLNKTNVCPKEGRYDKALCWDIFKTYNLRYGVVSCFFTWC